MSKGAVHARVNSRCWVGDLLSFAKPIRTQPSYKGKRLNVYYFPKRSFSKFLPLAIAAC